MSVSFNDLFRTFGGIGLLSFGGPAAQIALMHRELVDRKQWMSEPEYLRALSFCMLLPGPEAMQLATYAGWKLRGVAGGLLAGLLFVLPGAAVVLALAMIYAAWGQIPLMQALFMGIQACVVVIVIEALLRVSKRALKGRVHWMIAALSFIGIFFFALPFPLIIAAAAIWGALTAPATAAAPVAASTSALSITLRSIVLWGALWLVPLLALWVAGSELLFQIGWLFSKLAVVTFGGAYSVLAYMTQVVVTDYGWLTTAQMVDALGLAETTPGPLILVTEFVAYMAGHGAGGVALGLAAAVVGLWMTFVPCFLWIFAGAPWLEALTGRPKLTAALAAITAAVVGVILNLSIWFAAHVFFERVTPFSWGPIRSILPDLTSIDLPSIAIALIAAWLLLRRHAPLPLVLAVSAAGGIAIAAMQGAL